MRGFARIGTAPTRKKYLLIRALTTQHPLLRTSFSSSPIITLTNSPARCPGGSMVPICHCFWLSVTMIDQTEPLKTALCPKCQSTIPPGPGRAHAKPKAFTSENNETDAAQGLDLQQLCGAEPPVHRSTTQQIPSEQRGERRERPSSTFHTRPVEASNSMHWLGVSQSFTSIQPDLRKPPTSRGKLLSQPCSHTSPHVLVNFLPITSRPFCR